ncbi:hypothetical protein [cf. Phormidesmis sp. LEGE 11477]|uniref:hypothetical protein n=1 Tax=cf. Phormidesmis sp. LEGE 11477 TaxID=1828680 RepID=UPI00187DE207|nr:hypothetical protein [cf. Phormidesmis sp. LEGE 11477]MBE9063325.1 hypothetical protein [cf. Phormidesmis sp. LEGE 11477]
MDRIQEQASDLWALLFEEETAETYQAALNLTGKILTNTAQLLWLIICSVFVFGAWFSDASVKAGNNIRLWLDRQTSDDTTTQASKPVSETGKDMLDTSRTAIIKLLNRAREELGLEAEPLPIPTQKSVAPAATSSPAEETAASHSSAPSSSPATISPATSEDRSQAAPQTSTTQTSTTQTSAPQTSTPQTMKVSDSSSEDLTDDMTDDEVEDETADESWPPQTTDD